MTTSCGWLAGLLLSFGPAPRSDEADLILHNGKVVTADPDFSVRQAMSVKGGGSSPSRRSSTVAC